MESQPALQLQGGKPPSHESEQQNQNTELQPQAPCDKMEKSLTKKKTPGKTKRKRSEVNAELHKDFVIHMKTHRILPRMADGADTNQQEH